MINSRCFEIFTFSIIIVAGLLGNVAVWADPPQTINLQGTLQISAGLPAAGTHEFHLTFFDSPEGGATLANITGSMNLSDSGRFSVAVPIDPLVLEAVEAWYQLAVDLDDDGVDSDDLFPERVQVHSVPFALLARDSLSLGGNPADDYPTLSQMNAALAGKAPIDHDHGQFWRLGGNVLSPTETQFLGTLDNHDLELWAGGMPALRLIPGAESPSLVGGHEDNYILPGVQGGPIGGGGDPALGANRVSADYGVVSGGRANVAAGVSSTVGGGQINAASGDYATVSGGRLNVASGKSAAVGGGYINEASGDYSFVGGGGSNVASRLYATVGGGYQNDAVKEGATVGGGERNVASGLYAAVGGGYQNDAMGEGATVGGGERNNIEATGTYATIAGGYDNQATGTYATIAGGHVNEATASSATVGGGKSNVANGRYATVGGGNTNKATGDRATVGGGYNNVVVGEEATVAGGHSNTAAGEGGAVGGGDSNHADGQNAAIPGGYANTASGTCSFAAGNRAQAVHNGAFVWGDYSEFNYITSTAENQFIVRAEGGMWFGKSSSPSIPAGRFLNTSTGGYLSTGGTWTNSSDKHAKSEFKEVDPEEVLDKVSEMPITTWRYNAEDASVRHMGPMAQDFHAAFGLGDSDTAIGTIDGQGVALAAIQGLRQELKARDERIVALETRNAALEIRLAALEARIAGGGESGSPKAKK